VRGLRAQLAVALALWAGLAPACGGEGVGEEPGPAPAFELPALDGARVALEDLRGRPVVIDFWATWCPPCVQQIPVLNAFQEAHPEVAVLGIAVDVQGRKVVAPFAEEHGVRYRVLLGDEGLAQRFGVRGFPTLFVLDREGTVRVTHAGVIAAEALEDALASVQAEGSRGAADPTKPIAWP